MRSTPPHSVNRGERISNDGVLSCRLLLGLGWREAGRSLPGRFALGRERVDARLDLLVTALDRLVVAVVHLELLAQHEEVFIAIVTRERGGDLGFRRLAPGVAMTSEHRGIGHAGHNVAQDQHSGDPGHVADHGVELEVHQRQRLLHPLDTGGRPLHEGVSVTQQSTDGGDLRGGPKAAAQQAKGLEPLDPLAVGHIALASGHVLDVPGIDEEHREASCLQHFIERDPIHAGRLHRDGIDVTRREPVGQVDERMREAPELPHRLLGSVWGDRHPMAPGPNVDTRGIEMHPLQKLLFSGPSLRAPRGARGVLCAWHRSLALMR